MRPLRSLFLCAVLAACGGNPPSAPGAGPAPGAPEPAAPAPAAPVEPTAADTRGHGKPTAPVELSLTARALTGTATTDRFEVVMTATPQRAVDRLELALDGRPAQLMAAPARGETRATVEVARGEGKDVIGVAVVHVDGQRMARTAQLRIGAPAAAQPAGTLIHLPDGTPVQEVRP